MKPSRSFIGVVVLSVLCLPQVMAQSRPSDGTPSPGLEPAVPVGQLVRYVVTFMSSITSGTINPTGTAVSITNNGPDTCDVSVDWFRGHSTTISCTTNFTSLPPGQTTVLCSRTLPNWVSVCDISCSPALTFHEGRARVNSTNTTYCARTAVDARVFYFSGGDASVAAISNPKIVKTGIGNRGE